MQGVAKKPIRVIIVDDSLSYRNLLRGVFAADPAFEVVSHSVNGRLALPRIRHFQPDFVVLDQEMPEMDGLSTLKEIRQNWPGVGVVMFSSHTAEGARVTLQALEMGALDFVRKPTGVADLSGFLQIELLERIKQLARSRFAIAPSRPRLDAAGPSAGHAARICVIAVSTGGPPALRTLFAALPANPGAPIAVVQHMPREFTGPLASRLNQNSAVEVREAKDGDILAAGLALLAPGGRHMRLREGAAGIMVNLSDAPPELSCRPSANVLFRDAAEIYGDGALGLIMTGMGEDGYDGALRIKGCGGRVLAQSEGSCVVFGMPARPIREGLVDGVYHLEDLAEAICAECARAAAPGEMR